MGLLYCGKGEFTKALKQYERSLQIKKTIKGENSMDVAITLNNMR